LKTSLYTLPHRLRASSHLRLGFSDPIEFLEAERRGEVKLAQGGINSERGPEFI
jgi:hypothetical protein